MNCTRTILAIKKLHACSMSNSTIARRPVAIPYFYIYNALAQTH